jgi:Na+/H+-translocating membrane pyrophosphatase
MKRLLVYVLVLPAMCGVVASAIDTPVAIVLGGVASCASGAVGMYLEERSKGC